MALEIFEGRKQAMQTDCFLSVGHIYGQEG